MSFDGIFTYAMTQEIKRKIENGRISKIYQPYKNELLLVIRANGKNHKLLISVNPTYARIHFTDEQYDNPSEPAMFCMLLRKYLEGSFIEEIHQVGLDRIIIFTIRTRNEIGDISFKQLIVEIMGRHSNIILIDKEEKIILDSIKHVSSAVNRYRAILPGQPYIEPPKQEKVNPLLIDHEEDIVKKIDFNAGKIDKQIVEHFAGISPEFAKEVIFQAGLANRITIPKVFLSMIEDIKQERFQPQIISTPNKESFYILPLTHLHGDAKLFESISDMLDRFYFGKADRDRIKQQSHDIERFIQNEKAKNEKKIDKLEQTLKDAEKAEQYKLYGELLTANLYAMKRGDKEMEVLNYYSENQDKITITLDILKTPSENAQSYFQKYQKAKKSVSIVIEQINKAKEEVQYFDSLLQQIESATNKDVEEIREELIEEGYIKKRSNKGQRKNKFQKPSLEHYQASDGTEILVGKNNKQNDYLTNKVASRDDIWLHTKDIPGSHVVIRSKEPTNKTILEAANIAAYFSKAKNSSSVPVDYTMIRYVKKPNGAKPGFVTFENQQTVYVTPDEDLVVKLKK